MSTCCYGFNMRHEGHAWKKQVFTTDCKRQAHKIAIFAFLLQDNLKNHVM